MHRLQNLESDCIISIEIFNVDIKKLIKDLVKATDKEIESC